MPRTLAARLRRGLDLGDAEFDQLYPEWERSRSRVHWTPIAVARRAAQLLVHRPGTRVLDVGSGVGKFALVGALVTDGVFYGVEQRESLVEAARAAARGLGAKAAHFIHGDMMGLDWGMFDAFYLYNPFLEDLRSLASREQTGEDKLESFRAQIDFVRDRLERARPGTRVVTYHGFGGDLPPCYQLEVAPAAGIDDLELWVKRRGAAA